MNASQKMLAEGVGTFFLCFVAIATTLSDAPPIHSGAGLVGAALATGLVLSVAVNCFGGISGAHFNPAVTIGLLFTGRIKLDGALQYILSQLVGASIAAWGCVSLFPMEAVEHVRLGITLPAAENMPGVEGAWLTIQSLCVYEFILTFLLMVAIFGTIVDKRGQEFNITGFGIGFIVAANILACGPITGASMNPARSFGPALVYKLAGGEAGAGAFDLHWCYWVAPIAGATVAALVYDNFLLAEEDEE